MDDERKETGQVYSFQEGKEAHDIKVQQRILSDRLSFLREQQPKIEDLYSKAIQRKDNKGISYFNGALSKLQTDISNIESLIAAGKLLDAETLKDVLPKRSE